MKIRVSHLSYFSFLFESCRRRGQRHCFKLARKILRQVPYFEDETHEEKICRFCSQKLTKACTKLVCLKKDAINIALKKNVIWPAYSEAKCGISIFDAKKFKSFLHSKRQVMWRIWPSHVIVKFWNSLFISWLSIVLKIHFSDITSF